MIKAAVGKCDELLALVKKRRWFCQVSGLAKAILQDSERVDRCRGGKTISKSGQEWTFASSTRAAANRTRWKGIVAKSSVVPRPSNV